MYLFANKPARNATRPIRIHRYVLLSSHCSVEIIYQTTNSHNQMWCNDTWAVFREDKKFKSPFERTTTKFLFTYVIFKGVLDLKKWSVLWKWYFKFAFIHVYNNITLEHLLYVKLEAWCTKLVHLSLSPACTFSNLGSLGECPTARLGPRDRA